MGKLFHIDFKIVTEYFLNLVTLSKKTTKCARLINQIDKVIEGGQHPEHAEELRKTKEVLNLKELNFMQLKYPRAYFKLAISINVYPIPIATIIVIMIYQRFCQYSGQKLAIMALLALSIMLVLLIWVEHMLKNLKSNTTFHKLIVSQRPRTSRLPTEPCSESLTKSMPDDEPLK
jgi:hypothetical protein